MSESRSDSMNAEPSAERSRAPGALEEPFAMPPMEDALLHHLHNKVVHLPIVLAPVALMLLLMERRRPGAGAGAPWLIAAAALAGWIAFFAGRAQAGAFDDGPKEWLVGIHENWGTAAAIALSAWAALALWPPARRRLWLAGLVATAVVFAAAFYGGLVAHG
ncbi:MAG: hypothetical protein AABZ94_00940 [Candidatus Eisenbacteria bacterium]